MLRNFIEEGCATRNAGSGSSFLSHVLRNFIEDLLMAVETSDALFAFLSHVLRNFIEEPSPTVSAFFDLYS